MMKVPIKGLLIYESESIDPPIWSPDLRCPSERVGMYYSISLIDVKNFSA